MKVLYLTLKSVWYDMIEAGIKLEEYREISSYWTKRLCDEHKGSIGGDFMDKHKCIAYTFKPFTHVHFARGGHFHPSLPQMRFTIDFLDACVGRENWGAEPNKKYFTIYLGSRVALPNQSLMLRN